MERKKICKIVVGSHLYGTQGPQSDRDYLGVFLPSRQDLLGIERYPAEISESVKSSEGPRNTTDDIDCKFFSLGRYMELAREGQPSQLELLFANQEHHVVPPTEEWKTLVAKRDWFVSKQSIVPFIRFAEAQAHKAVIKGDNLDMIQKILAWGHTQSRETLGTTVGEQLQLQGGIGPVVLTSYSNASGADLIKIAGRAFDTTTTVRRLLGALEVIERKYGTRSRAAVSAGVDWKSIHHAFRLTFEAAQLLTEGCITLPFQGPTLEFLRAIRYGQKADFDWSLELKARLAELEVLSVKSSLPESAEWDKIDQLHQDLLENQLVTI